jgi:hypothetical protein
MAKPSNKIQRFALSVKNKQDELDIEIAKKRELSRHLLSKDDEDISNIIDVPNLEEDKDEGNPEEDVSNIFDEGQGEEVLVNKMAQYLSLKRYK